jgi:hypothetical protein
MQVTEFSLHQVPVSVGLGAQGTCMQFIRFLGRSTAVGQGTESICFRAGSLVFTAI